MKRAEHNRERWLEVRWLNAAGGRANCPPNLAGWYVVRTCRCHRDERVTMPLKTQADAQRAMAAMLEASRSLAT